MPRFIEMYCSSAACELATGVMIRMNPATLTDPEWLDSDSCVACGSDLMSEPHDDPDEEEAA